MDMMPNRVWQVTSCSTSLVFERTNNPNFSEKVHDNKVPQQKSQGLNHTTILIVKGTICTTQQHHHDLQVQLLEEIQEVKDRSKEHCVGYEYNTDISIKIDSQSLHREIVQPVLALVSSESIYENINENQYVRGVTSEGLVTIRLFTVTLFTYKHLNFFEFSKTNTKKHVHVCIYQILCYFVVQCVKCVFFYVKIQIIHL